MEVELPGPRLFVARVEPYRLSDLEKLLSSIRNHPAVAITPIGKTVEGRTLEIVRVGNPAAPFRVFIRARAHPWEAGGNWVVQGLIRRLLQDDAEAKRFLGHYCVYIMPMANKDGVARGWTRFNLQGEDLNRDWDRPADPELAPENHALETWLEAMIEQGQRPHLALELHNDGAGKLHLSRSPVPGLDRHLARMKALEELLRRHTWFTEGTTPPSFQNSGTLGDGWLARYGIDAVVHEFNASWIAGLNEYPSARHWETYGAQLCRVLHEYFDHEQASAGRLLEPFFQPPAEFADQLGSYRSPLLFNDGASVQSAADWPRRRAEILKQWHELMGPWPPVLEKPGIEFLSETNRETFIQRRVRLEIAPDQTGDGWLLKPPGPGPFPAVLVVYYEPETSVGLNPKQALRDFGLQLTRRGFVTLSIGTPGGNAWQPEVGSARCQPLSFHAYVAANCWQALANLPEVDRARIGVVGHSYGGKWAMFAAALWDKFACVAVSDPGIVFDETRPNVNYWEPWYLGFNPDAKRPKPGPPTADNPRTGAYRRMIETGRDLQELHALIAPRPFLVSGGAEDPPSRWIALNHAVAVNRLLGFTNRVALTSRAGHDPTEVSNEQLYAFFECFLQANKP
jgi:dienelactone hydrolase